MRRHAIGVIALVLLLIAAAFEVWPPDGPNSLDLQSAGLRIGTVMVVIWLAYDHLQRAPRWFWWGLPIFLIAIARRPRLLLLFVPMVIVLAILRPRPGSRRQ